MANIRSAYAEVTSAYLSDNKKHSVDVALVQTKEGWQNGGTIAGVKLGETANSTDTISAKPGTPVKVAIDAEGSVTIDGIKVKGDTVNS